MRRVPGHLVRSDVDCDQPVDAAPRASKQRSDLPDRTKWWARCFGGLFLIGSAIHITLVSGWPHAYDSFADNGIWSFIGHAWRSALVPNAHFLIPLLAVFEATVGILILVRRTRRLGIGCAIAFSVALMLFGFGFWAWSLPVIGLLAYFWHLEGRVDVHPQPTEEQNPKAGALS